MKQTRITMASALAAVSTLIMADSPCSAEPLFTKEGTDPPFAELLKP